MKLLASGRALSFGASGLTLLILALAPVIFTSYFESAILTKALWLGIAAVSLIFLAGYGGMVSLGQVGIYGIAGLTMGNFVKADGGSPIAVKPWVGVILGILVATAMGLVFGAVASRSEGIYFLMITLAFAVIVFYFWGQVVPLSGFGGLNNVTAPGYLGKPAQHPNPLYYTALIVSLGVLLLIRYLVRTPFGIALQGIRDDPTRMRALGYNVELHRTLAFGAGAFIASLAGILSVWWNTRIDPTSINLTQTINVLVIAVIGGLFRLEGAWIGAIVFVIVDNYSRSIGFVGPRFSTLIGAIFLVIVLLSPGGLVGIWESVRALARRRVETGSGGPVEPSEPAPAGPGS